MDEYAETDPRHHTQHIKEQLEDLEKHLRHDVGVVSEPRAQALFETTAEVLEGLRAAFDHYERGDEPAWRR